MKKGHLLNLILLFLALTVLAVLFFLSGGREKIKDVMEMMSPDTPSAETDSREKRKIVLYFLSEADALLHSEQREIVAGPTMVEEAMAAVRELIKGSRLGLVSPLPPETELLQVYITRDGVAYVDFSREFIDRHPSGSSAEIATVYAVVNTMTANFKSIKRVFILVDGSEKETLGGHISLGRPLLPDYGLVAR